LPQIQQAATIKPALANLKYYQANVGDGRFSNTKYYQADNLCEILCVNRSC